MDFYDEYQRHAGYNRTYVELKYMDFYDEYQRHAGYSRTYVELK